MTEMQSAQLTLLPLLPGWQQKGGLKKFTVLWVKKITVRYGDRQTEGTELYRCGTVPLTTAFRRQSQEPCEFKTSQSHTVRLEGREEGRRREGGEN